MRMSPGKTDFDFFSRRKAGKLCRGLWTDPRIGFPCADHMSLIIESAPSGIAGGGVFHLLFAQLLVLFIGGQHGLDGGVAQAIRLQSGDPGNGGTAGGTHGVFEGAGVLPGLQHHGGGAYQHLGGVLHGLLPGQAHHDPAVGQGLKEGVDVGGTASGHRGKGVHVGLVHEVYPPGAGENVLYRLDVVGLGGGGGAQSGHALPNGYTGVGHQPQQGEIPGLGREEGAKSVQSYPSRHRDEHFGGAALQTGAQLRQHPRQQVRLDAEKEVIGLFKGLGIVVDGVAAQFLGQGLGFGIGAVGQIDLVRSRAGTGGPGQGGAHVSAADKSDTRHINPSLGLPQRAVDGAENGPQGGPADVVALAYAEHILTVGGLQVDVTHGLGVRAGGDGVLFVVHKLIAVNGGLRQVVQGVEEGVDGAVALAPDLHGVALVAHFAHKLHLAGVPVAGVLLEAVALQLIGLGHGQIFLVEELEDLLGLELLTHPVGLLLHHGAELGVHGTGQIIAEVLLHDKGGAALAGLGIDADDGLVLPSHVGGVDGQIGHLPHVGAAVLHVVEALVDGVLVAAGEGGEHQLAHVGLALPDLHLGAPLVHVPDFVDVVEVQLGVNALGPHVHSQGDHVHVAGALAVAEESGLHAVSARQQTQLGGGHAGATVVVGVEGDDGPLPAGQVADEVLQHVGKLVGHAVFHGGWQVQNDGVLRGGVEVVQHGGADFHGVVHLGAHKGLGGVFKAQVGSTLNDGLSHFIDEVGGVGGNLGDAVAVHAEHHLALQGRGGVIEVENHVLGPTDGLKGAADEVFPGLHQHLNGDVVGDVAALNELPTDLVLGLGGGGEANLNFFDADVQQGVEVFQLLLEVHGVNEGLVSVPQVHRAPDRRLGQHFVRPGAVGDGLGLEGDILLKAWFQIHGEVPPLFRCGG